MAAALVGCLPLAEREVARLVAAHGGDPGLLSTLTYRSDIYTTSLTYRSVGFTVMCECLHRACLAGSLPLAQLFVAQGAQVGNGRQHLRAAVRGGNLQLVSFILAQAGTKLQLPMNDVFECAAGQGNVDMLELLLRVSVPTSNRTISEVAPSGSLEAVQLLLDRGCYHPEPMWINFAFDSGSDLGQCTALHHAVLDNYEEMARCLLECGVRVDVKAKGMRMTALGLARQYGNKASRVVIMHRPSKRMRKSASEAADKKKNENENENENESEEKEEKEKQNEDDDDGDDEKNGDNDGKTKPAKKKQKQTQEPSAGKREEKELEAEVRRLAKLKDDAKLDVFTLRQMLRRRGVLAGDVPKRKLPLLQLTVDWLSAGN